MICENTNPCFFKMLNGEEPSCKKGCLDKGKCQQGKIITCTDSAKTYYLGNPKRLTAAVVKIDGFVMDEKRPGRNKCDFVILIGDSAHEPIAVLVELKGENTDHAVTQIQATLTALQGTLGKFERVYGRILGIQTPDIHTKKYRDLQRMLMGKKYNGNLESRRWRHKKKKDDSPDDSVTVAENGIILQ